MLYTFNSNLKRQITALTVTKVLKADQVQRLINEYRPIVVLSNPAKIFETGVHNSRYSVEREPAICRC